MKTIYLGIMGLVILFSISTHAQHIPLHPSALQQLETELLKKENHRIHTGIKPYNYFEVGQMVDSIQREVRFEKEIDKKFGRWLFNAAFNDHFIEIKDKKEGNYAIRINPLANIRVGKSSNLDNIAFTNTRGVQVMGHIGKKFIFYSDLYENQARFPKYIQDFVGENSVIPGQGYPKNFSSTISDAGNAYDFAYANGHIAYQPNKYFNFQLGHGKHFIGEGHRSMILSDNAFNYPYFKITTSFWKLKYVNLYTQMRDLRGPGYSNFDIKYMVSHYLSLDVTKKWNIGLYETIVNQSSSNGLDVNYFNPIILYRPIEYSIGSRDGNALIGLTSSFKLNNKMMLYGQFMLDEFHFKNLLKQDGWWANKYAFQLGFKSYDTFVTGLKFLTEVNYARPFIYSHGTTGRNYGHYKQALAHPLGANFVESVTQVSYQKNRWFGEIELMVATQGKDTLNSNYGANVFLPNTTRSNEYGNETLQGIKAKTLFVDIKAGYIINPRTNLRAEIGMTYRSYKPEVEVDNLKSSTTTYIYFGIQTALTNKYYDF